MSVATLVERLEQLAVEQLDVGGVAGGVRDLQRVKGFVAEVEHALARRATELADAGSGAPAPEVLARGGNCSTREAARAARRAEVLGEMPSLSAQLRKGRIGIEHADAVTTIAARMGAADRAALLSLDGELATAAASATPTRFRRHVERIADQLRADRGVARAERQRRAATLSTGIDDETGMYWLRGEFDPESGARLFRAIDAETRSRASRAAAAPDDGDVPPRSQLAARALVDLATATGRSRRPGRTELLVLVDLDTITNGLRDSSICELDDGTGLPVETARRLACDAHIIPVVLNGESMPLDVGRSRRLATDDQRRALRAMYRTCGIGECDTPFDDCEIHHVDEWDAHDGETNLDRLVPSCSRHHHLVHEGGWRLELDPVTRELTITLPDGTELSRSRPHSVTATTVGRAA